MFPLILSVCVFPFAYLCSLIAAYESLFVRLECGREKSRELKRAIKLQIIKHCKLSLKKVSRARNQSIFNIMSISDMCEIEDLALAYEENL